MSAASPVLPRAAARDNGSADSRDSVAERRLVRHPLKFIGHRHWHGVGNADPLSLGERAHQGLGCFIVNGERHWRDNHGLIVRLLCLTLLSEQEGVAMSTLKVTAKGQVTLRQDVLKHLDVRPGEKISVEKLPDGRIEVRAVRSKGQISDVFDFLKEENGPSLSIEEINELAADGWAGKR